VINLLQVRKVRLPEGETLPKADSTQDQARKRIVRRVALELKNGMYVNLGIGIPTLLLNYIPENNNVTLHSENGILGLVRG